MKNLFVFIIATSALFFTSCEEKPEELVKDTLSIDLVQLEFSAEDIRRRERVKVITNVEDWKISKSEEADWLVVSEPQGDVFVVAVRTNEVTRERTGTITVTAGNAEPVVITVKQLAADDKTPILSVDRNELQFAPVGAGIDTVAVKANNVGDWKIASSVEWIILDREADNLLVSVERNWQTTERTGTVTLTGTGVEPVTINITQFAYSTDWASDPNLQELRAFPGAEGFGASTTGGRGGKVLYVTTLLDNNSQGSLRWAINQTGKRIIVFKVSGNIILSSRLPIKNGDVTIAGHTAPGDGICLQGYDVTVDASNVIIRYMRFRMGDLNNVESDAIWGRYQKNVILDHCSMSWCVDECASFYDNENFTMQWCIISESLRISKHEKGAHGYGGIWGGKNVSFHHNLLAHHDSRNPRFTAYTYNGADRKTAGLVDFRNNVIYNWGGNSGYAGEGGRYNMVNNYYQPSETSNRSAQIFAPGRDSITGIYGSFYVNGNIMMLPGGSVNRKVTNDNWEGMTNRNSFGSDLRTDTEYETGPIHTHTAQEAYELVLAHSGASYKRDIIDDRVVSEVRNLETPIRASGNGDTKPGLIDTQEDVGGWCPLISLTPPADKDADGMPDEWEILNGLDPNDSTDGAKKTLTGETYTNLEVYLYDLLR